MSKKQILSSLISGLLVVSLSGGFAVAAPGGNGGGNNGGGNNGGGNNGGGGNQGLNPQAECDLLTPDVDGDYLPLAKYNWEGGAFVYDGGDGGDIFSFSNVDTDGDNEPHSGDWTITDGSSYAEGLIVKSATNRDLSIFAGVQSGSFSKTVNNAISHLTFCYLVPIDMPNDRPDNGGGGDPLAIDLTELEVKDNGTVRWATGVEPNNAQFHVWVRCPAVPAQGNGQVGAIYEFNPWEGCTAIEGVVLEDVDVNGRSSFHLDLMNLK